MTGNPKLNGSITRLQIAQIASKALKLSTTNLSNKKPFTDTNDVYVQALNAAGIIEGYFSNGTSTYKPNSTPPEPSCLASAGQSADPPFSAAALPASGRAA